MFVRTLMPDDLIRALDPFIDSLRADAISSNPNTNVRKFYLGEGKIVYEVPVTGFSKDEVKAYIDDSNKLVVEAALKKDSEKRNYKGQYESVYQSKRESVSIPKGYEVKSVKYDSGLISITLESTENAQYRTFDL